MARTAYKPAGDAEVRIPGVHRLTVAHLLYQHVRELEAEAGATRPKTLRRRHLNERADALRDLADLIAP